MPRHSMWAGWGLEANLQSVATGAQREAIGRLGSGARGGNLPPKRPAAVPIGQKFRELSFSMAKSFGGVAGLVG